MELMIVLETFTDNSVGRSIFFIYPTLDKMLRHWKRIILKKNGILMVFQQKRIFIVI